MLHGKLNFFVNNVVFSFRGRQSFCGCSCTCIAALATTVPHAETRVARALQGYAGFIISSSTHSTALPFTCDAGTRVSPTAKRPQHPAKCANIASTARQPCAEIGCLLCRGTEERCAISFDVATKRRLGFCCVPPWIYR